MKTIYYLMVAINEDKIVDRDVEKVLDSTITRLFPQIV